ncbi:MAG: hypothetical protein L0Y74_06345 [candidate division Zixibacteria bacterium]|nr:hypothetical protein [candidate division Zixibacteria bacterium]
MSKRDLKETINREKLPTLTAAEKEDRHRVLDGKVYEELVEALKILKTKMEKR